MDAWRATLAIATLVGGLVTILGLLTAFVSARSAIPKADAKAKLAVALGEEHAAEIAAASRLNAGDPSTELIHERYDQKYAQAGLIRPTRGNVTMLPALESRQLLLLTLDAARNNLVWAGGGLVLSTAASVVATLTL